MQFADFGDILYIIIFLLLLFGGSIEKFIRNKKRQDTQIPEPQDTEFGEDDPLTETEQSRPKTFEEMVKAILQPEPEPLYEPEEVERYPVEAESLEEIPAVSAYLQNVENQSEVEVLDMEESHPISDSKAGNGDETSRGKYEFDIRQAIIASEILNRKY